ncbi:MAG: DNA repair protein RecN [candidate division WOR-3 bacterium]
MAIQRLIIKDYLFVDQVEIEFGPSLNIITGETGAGKSLIIGALNIALGEKVEWDLLNNKESEIILTVSATEKERKFLEENGIECEDEIIIRRVLSPQLKKSRIYINMTPSTQSFLRELTEFLVDIHGQHQHQRLLVKESHIDFLDSFAGLEAERAKMKSLYNEMVEKRTRLQEILKREQEAREKEEYFRYKLEELEKANLRPGEEEEILERVNILSNIEKLQNQITESIALLYDSEDSAYEKVFRTFAILENLSSIDSRIKEFSDLLKDLPDRMEEVWRNLVEYRNSLVYSPEELDELRNRLAFLKNLKNKYRKSIEELIEEKENLKRELEFIENFDTEIKNLEEEVSRLKDECEKQANVLHHKRVETAKKLKELIESELKDLAMEKAKFVINIEELPEITPQGKDSVEFFISTNPGEPPRPLNKVVSGGELSRIMLAIKRVLAEVDDVGTLVFDEADTGIGGKVAEMVGKKMKSISKNRQVIVITHLPQIAAFGDTHFLVEKKMEGNRTLVNIRKLTEDERKREIARMLSGEKITEESIKYAEKFLESVRREDGN